ncbi:hypothetical protein ACET3Z_009189 [Daucus carota]
MYKWLINGEQNNNSVKGQQAGLKGVGKIDHNGGGNNHMAAVGADGGRIGIAATGSNNEKQINASKAYYKDREQLDMLGTDEFDQFCRWLKNENTKLKGDLKEVSEEVAKYKVGVPSHVGLVAPVDVVVPPGNTGLDPSRTSFFQVLNIPTKINKEKYKYLLAAKDLLKAAKRSACHEDTPYNSFEALFNITDQDGYNVLQLAVQQNNANAVWLILHQDPAYQNGRSSKNKELKSLIYMAAGKRYNDTVKGLCIIYEAGNTVDYEEQTLLQAAIIGHDREKHEYLFIAKDLLKAAKRSACHEDAPYNSFEALFNITDEDGYNVLQLAVHQNNQDAVELILKEDPAYQQQRSNKNSELKSLAYIAAEKGYKDIVKLVCESYEARNEIGRVGQTTLLLET